MRKPKQYNDLRSAKYKSVIVSLPPQLCEKLHKSARNRGESDSAMLREMISKYFKMLDKKGLVYEPYRKTEFTGNTKIKSRTIGRDQDIRLRELQAKTGLSMSEMMRRAVEWY